MKVEADLKTLLVFKADNRSTYKGCTSPEDEWDILVTAETLPELEEAVAEELVDTGIVTESPKLYTAEHIVYKNATYMVDKIMDLDVKHFLTTIIESDYYKKLVAAKEIARKQQEEAQEKQDAIDLLNRLDQDRTKLISKLSGTVYAKEGIGKAQP